MLDLIPPAVARSLRDRYLAGVSDAEHFFSHHSADEDSVTGALGQALAMREPLMFSENGRLYELSISYRKIRGRGPKSPERFYGIDGIFQMRISAEDGSVIRQKGLPFQAKINWHGKDRNLAEQARKMERLRGGIVIDYTDHGYSACASNVVVAAKGSRRQVEKFGALRPLGQVLGTDFLNCTAGTIGQFLDQDAEPATIDEYRSPHVISTVVRAIS